MAGQYVYLPHGDRFLDLIDDALEGYGVGLNHPVFQPDDDYWIGVDGFVSWGTLGLGGATQFPPPASLGLQYDLDISHVSVGGTVYAELEQPIRPLMQVGATFSRSRSMALVNGFGGTAVDRETDLLLTVGLEADLNEWLALRSVIDLETEGSLRDSTFINSLILWPTENIFIRGGAILPLEGSTVGGAIAAGVTF